MKNYSNTCYGTSTYQFDLSQILWSHVGVCLNSIKFLFSAQTEDGQKDVDDINVQLHRCVDVLLW